MSERHYVPFSSDLRSVVAASSPCNNSATTTTKTQCSWKPPVPLATEMLCQRSHALGCPPSSTGVRVNLNRNPLLPPASACVQRPNFTPSAPALPLPVPAMMLNEPSWLQSGDKLMENTLAYRFLPQEEESRRYLALQM